MEFRFIWLSLRLCKRLQSKSLLQVWSKFLMLKWLTQLCQKFCISKQKKKAYLTRNKKSLLSKFRQENESNRKYQLLKIVLLSTKIKTPKVFLQNKNLNSKILINSISFLGRRKWWSQLKSQKKLLSLIPNRRLKHSWPKKLIKLKKSKTYEPHNKWTKHNQSIKRKKNLRLAGDAGNAIGSTHLVISAYMIV